LSPSNCVTAETASAIFFSPPFQGWGHYTPLPSLIIIDLQMQVRLHLLTNPKVAS